MKINNQTFLKIKSFFLGYYFCYKSKSFNKSYFSVLKLWWQKENLAEKIQRVFLESGQTKTYFYFFFCCTYLCIYLSISMRYNQNLFLLSLSHTPQITNNNKNNHNECTRRWYTSVMLWMTFQHDLPLETTPSYHVHGVPKSFSFILGQSLRLIQRGVLEGKCFIHQKMATL